MIKTVTCYVNYCVSITASFSMRSYTRFKNQRFKTYFDNEIYLPINFIYIPISIFCAFVVTDYIHFGTECVTPIILRILLFLMMAVRVRRKYLSCYQLSVFSLCWSTRYWFRELWLPRWHHSSNDLNRYFFSIVCQIKHYDAIIYLFRVPDRSISPTIRSRTYSRNWDHFSLLIWLCLDFCSLYSAWLRST